MFSLSLRLACLMNSEGDSPVTFLNVVEKYDLDWMPAVSAIASTVSFLKSRDSVSPADMISSDNNTAARVTLAEPLPGYTPEVVGDFLCHTGNSYIACVRPSSPVNDDWVMSPELSGNAQTVTLWAKTLGSMLDEMFSVSYSETGTSPEDFSVVKDFVASGEYEEYSVELPADARYFAVHCTSFYGGMLMIDDVTYESRPRELKGFNVYRNGEMVGFVEAGSNTYT